MKSVSFMRYLQAALTLLMSLWVGSAQSQPDGPFGVTMGSPISNYTACKPGTKLGWYSCAKLPKSHPAFESYLIKAHAKTGVCFVKGMGRNVENDSYGSRTQLAVQDLAAQITQTYGRHSKVTDFLQPGSIWDESRYWMMAARKQERFYSYDWDAGNYKSDVQQIAVIAQALSSDIGFAVVEFYFKNYKECDAALNADAGKAF